LTLSNYKEQDPCVRTERYIANLPETQKNSEQQSFVKVPSYSEQQSFEQCAQTGTTIPHVSDPTIEQLSTQPSLVLSTNIQPHSQPDVHIHTHSQPTGNHSSVYAFSQQPDTHISTYSQPTGNQSSVYALSQQPDTHIPRYSQPIGNQSSVHFLSDSQQSNADSYAFSTYWKPVIS
jgi:hypothetical protein